MRRARQHLVLAIVATDATFARERTPGGELWVGKCIHCNSRLAVSLAGELLGGGTIEHILPRTAGGTDDPRNLAIACARCNHGKGVRHDGRYARSERAREVVARLAERRQERWREPA